MTEQASAKWSISGEYSEVRCTVACPSSPENAPFTSQPTGGM